LRFDGCARENTMKDWLPRLLVAALGLYALAAHAETTPAPLPPLCIPATSSCSGSPETQLVTVAGGIAPTQESFSIETAQDLVVTFTDLQIPAALVSANLVVTQGASVVGTTALLPPATTATLSLPGAVGDYTLSVIGVPSSTVNVGTFTVCVAPAATSSTPSTSSACIADASLAGNFTIQTNPAAPTLSTVSSTLTVVTGGTYTFTYADLQFPVALAVAPSFSLFQGTTPIAVPLGASPATVNLPAGTYTLFGIAEADPTATAGLYGITVQGPAGLAPILSSANPVGTLSAASQASNPSAQSVTLGIHDFGFPSALASAQAIVTAGGSSLGAAASGQPASFSAPAGTLQVWSYATPGTGAGTYEVDLAAPGQTLLQSAAGVNNGGVLAYAYVTPNPLSAASYTATGNDFQFPVGLLDLQFAVAQNDAILPNASASAAGSFGLTAAAVPAVVLVAATPPTNGNGFFDVNLQTTGTSPQIVFDQTQGVSASGAFTSQTLTIATAGNYDVTLTDLGFPVKFANLDFFASNNGAVLGKIYGGGTFTIAATPGNYQLNFIATPGSTSTGTQVQYGLYGLQVINSPPTVTLAASPTTVTDGATTTLSWTTTNATSCTASGGTFTGSEPTASGTATVTVSATTTYSLACTGAGGSATQSVTVTGTAAPGHSGGGQMGGWLLGLLGLLSCARLRSAYGRS
jgi:hypothetical protein